ETEYQSKRTKYDDRRAFRSLSRMYSRNAKLIAQGKPLDATAPEIVRVELMPNMLGRKMTLAKLQNSKCLIEGMKIGHVRASSNAPSAQWLIWCDIALSRGAEHASARLGLDPLQTAQFIDAWTNPSDLLVSPTTLWQYWQETFEQAKLPLLLS